MRKITKLMLTLALLVVGVGGAKVHAGKVYGTPSVTYQAGWSADDGGLSGTMTWKRVGSIASVWYILDAGLPTGDITSYTKIHVTLSDFSENASHIKLVIKNSRDQIIDEKLYTGDNDVFFNNAKFSDFDFTTVTEIKLWNGEAEDGKTVNNENPASVKVESVYMQKPTDIITNNGFGDAITSLDYITGTNETAAQKFVISDNGTKAKYFKTNNENENAAVANVPNDAYFYFTLEKYTGDAVSGDNIYKIKVTNADGDGYPRGTSGGYYLNAIKTYNSAVIAGPEAGWSEAGNELKDALWYVTYNAGML